MGDDGDHNYEVGSSLLASEVDSLFILLHFHSILRLLPAFRVFMKQISSIQFCNFDISYKVYSYVEPFSGAKEEEMKRFIH